MAQPPSQPVQPASSLAAVAAICPAASARVLEKLADLAAQEAQLASQLEDPAVLSDHRRVRDLSQQRTALRQVAESWSKLTTMAREAADLRALQQGPDAELAAMAQAELPSLEQQAPRLLEQALSALVNAEDDKIGSVILEVRAGTGGDEASLWARDLLEMYQRLAGRKSWQMEVLELTPEPGVGGVRNAVASVRGPGVWSALSFEAGVHSVKRVPATEAQGRVHTSTASVAVLPEPEDVDVKIDWANDVEEFATRAQGPGGQNVNKVETAWQIHHKPSGIIIKMMEAKSQQQNRERARRLLMARLFELERQRQHAQRTAARKDQIGTAGRSEKIRTYRWKEGIAADERLPDEYQLRDLLAGNFDDLLADLIRDQTTRRVAEL